jgi:hypothetical protein
MAKQTHQYLPEEIVRPANIRHIFNSLLGCFALVFLINFLADWYLAGNSPNRGYRIVREKWEKLLGLNRPVDFLILGDSTGLQGVEPKTLNKKLGVTSLNFCTIGNMLAVNSAWMLDKYIQKYGPPRQVLLVHVYDVWHRKANTSTRLVLGETPLPWGYWQQFDPKLNLGPQKSFSVPSILGSQQSELKLDLESVGTAQLFLAKYFPLLMQNQTLSTLFLSPQDFFLQNEKFRSSLKEDGFLAVSPNPERVQESMKEHLNFVRENKFSLSEPNAEALEKIIALAEKYDFDVYLVTSPVYENLYRDRDFAAYLGQVEATLSNIADKSKKVHYIKSMSFPKNQMNEAEHLAESGAKAYTTKLADKILASQQLQK